jgi:hypothetical protein
MKFESTRDRGARNRFGLMLSIFLGMLLISPLFENSIAAGFAGDIFFYLFLFAAAFSIRGGRYFKLVVFFGVLVVVGEVASYFTYRLIVFILTNFLSCAFLFLVTLEIGFYLSRQQEIRLDTVMGGLCVYVLMGSFWTILFVNLELIHPGSFSFGIHGPNPNIDEMYALLFYYSFVTLLTIGYGDVVAMSNIAQTLTILEGLIGQFYIIFFIASLVGMYIYRRQIEPKQALRSQTRGSRVNGNGENG